MSYPELRTEPMSDEARELAIFAENNEPWYRCRFTAIARNMTRKHRKGTLKPEQMIETMQTALTDVAKAYAAEGCSSPSEWRIFTPAIRRETARYLLDTITAELAIGNEWD